MFLVDEIGQFIGQDTHLMLNLQTIVENLGTTCEGRAWVVVTSQEDIDAVHECTGRVKRLSEQISLAVEEWRMAPTVKALQSLRGVSLIIAAITVAELQRGHGNGVRLDI